MERDRLLRFSSSSLGRAAEWISVLAGPIGFPLAALAVLWGMIRLPFPASRVFTLFAPILVALYAAAGLGWAVAAAGVASVIGMTGAIFSVSENAELRFGMGTALLWVLLAFLARDQARRRALRNRLSEECDRLDLDATHLSSSNQKLQERILDYRERISAHSRLQSFTDDLIGAYSREELLSKSKAGLAALFPKAKVTLRMFTAPAAPDEDDEWGRTALQSDQPRLFSSRNSLVPTWTSGTFIFLPLKIQGRPAGWIGLDAHREGRPLQLLDLRLAAIAVDLIAIALGNAELYAQTEALAVSDGLTGLYTRGHFNERLKEEFAKARHRGAPFSLLLVDADHFKSVNDTHGHRLGDEVLRWLARLILAQARQTDFVARYGGEEFAVLMPNTRAADAGDFARRLCRHVASTPFRWEGKTVRLTLSGGIASLEGAVEDEMDLIQRADIALYRAKNGGRNRVEISS